MAGRRHCWMWILRKPGTWGIAFFMVQCIFCDIVNNRIPNWIIYQNKEVVCFLPLSPSTYGHTIITPKQHIEDIYSAPEIILKEMIVVSKKLTIHYRNQIAASGINILHASGISAQQSVPHFHLHLIPRFDNDGLNAWPNFPAHSFDKDKIMAKLRVPE